MFKFSNKKGILCLWILLIISFPISESYSKTNLIDLIIEYNLHWKRERLKNGQYAGEEGILCVDPVVGKELGLSTFIDRDLLEGKEFMLQAKGLKDRINVLLDTRSPSDGVRAHIKKIVNAYLRYMGLKQEARKKMLRYRDSLRMAYDERKDKERCIGILKRLLRRSLNRRDNQLRDALGELFNILRGYKDQEFPLNTDNIEFVNHIIHSLKGDTLKRYHLDRVKDFNPSFHSLHALEKLREENELIPLFKKVFNSSRSIPYPVDPLLFLSLIKRESAFDPYAISPVGAAGLAQLMPETASSLGLKVYIPSYYLKAKGLLKRERRLREEVWRYLKKIRDKTHIESAKKAWQMRQDAIRLKNQRERLFKRYRRELLNNPKRDQRLDPMLCLSKGLRYFSEMMRLNRGDISLALASYNAGYGRVKKYRGIPPFEETITFRNMVLRYYREYLKRIGIKS